MKKATTAVAVILISATLMLIPALFHAGFHFADVDWQGVVERSLMVDVAVYLASLYANRTQAHNN